MNTVPSERDGRVALRDHILALAETARSRYGPVTDRGGLLRLLGDRSIVRYPVETGFNAGPLQPGEFAHAQPLGEHPRTGFRIFVHPALLRRDDLWIRAVVYHLARVNYGDIAGPDECELFGANLLGLDVEEYYRALCELADALWPPPS